MASDGRIDSLESSSPRSSADGVRVAVRVRPLNEREKSLGAGPVGVAWGLTPTSMTQLVDQRPVSGNSFAFDHVFLEGVDNETVYKELAAPVVLSTVEGVNGVIFAYGQTAAGKTHTMLGTGSDPGITRRAISDLFASIAASRGRGFLLRASYIEIYNEVIKDLLGGGGENLKIHEDVVNKRVYVNAKEEVVISVNDVMDMLAAGEETRAVGVTNMNERSSRSHTIFTLRVESREIRAGPNGEPLAEDEDSGVAVRASSLTLVDLAGSERVAFTKAEGQRLKEGGHINKSLLTLGTVINKLSSEESRNSAHIPYRDSKLTRILQPALGGNARTAIVCAVTPSLLHLDETLSTLRFASRAKKVTNNAQCNEYLDDRAKLRRAEKEISKLKQDMAALRDATGITGTPSAGRGGMTITVQSEKNARKRIKLFHDKFEKLVALAVPGTGAGASAASPGNPDMGTFDSRMSVDSTMPMVVPDSWDKRARLRDALDLRNAAKANSTNARMNDDEDEKGDAELRMRALKAERELGHAQSAIECERIAMEAEVQHLVSVADNAQRAQNAAQSEWEQAMSLLATAQTASLVDELIEGAMMISEREKKISVAASELQRYQGIEELLTDTSTKLKTTEKTLSEALKREKRGVGPVLKEKTALQSKMQDLDGKLKGARQNLSKMQAEKAALQREMKSKNSQYKILNAEVEKHRKHKTMADERVAKRHADEKRKLDGEISTLNENLLSERGIVGAQKTKILELQQQLVSRTVDLNETSNKLQDLQDKFERQGDELTQTGDKADELAKNLQQTKSNLQEEQTARQEEQEKAKAEISEKVNALAVAASEHEKQQEIIANRETQLQVLQTKNADLETEFAKHVETSSAKLAEATSAYEQLHTMHVVLQNTSTATISDLEKRMNELQIKHTDLQSVYEKHVEASTAKLAVKTNAHKQAIAARKQVEMKAASTISELKKNAKASFAELENRMITANNNFSQELGRITSIAHASEKEAAVQKLENEELMSSLDQLSKEFGIVFKENHQRKDQIGLMEKEMAENKVHSLDQQRAIEDAQETINAANEKMINLQGEIQQVQVELNNECSKSNEALEIASMAQDELQKQEERADKYAVIIKNFEVAHAELEKEVQNLKLVAEKYDVLGEEVLQLRQSVDSKDAEFEAQKEFGERQIANLRRVLEAKDMELQEQGKSMSALTEQIEVQENGVCKLRETLETREKDMLEKDEVASQECARLRNELETKQGELDDALQHREEVQFLRADLSELRESLQQKENDLCASIQDREDTSAKMQVVVQELQNRLELKQTAAVELQEVVNELRETLDVKDNELQHVVMERKKEANLLAVLKQQGENQEVKKELQEEVAALRATVEMKENQLEQARSLDNEVKSLRSVLEKQREILREKDNELQKANAAHTEVDKLRVMLEKRDDELARLTASQATESSPEPIRSSDFAAASNALLGDCGSLRSLSNEVRVLREVNVNVAQGPKQSENRVREAEKAKRRKLMVRNEGLIRESQDAAREKVRLLERLKDMDSRVEYLEAKLMEYGRGEGAIAKLQKRVRKRDVVISKLESEVAAQRRLAEEKGLKNERALLTRVSEAEGGINAVQTELNALKSSLQRSQTERDAIAKDAHRLRQRMQQREALWTKSLIDRRERERVGVASALPAHDGERQREQ